MTFTTSPLTHEGLMIDAIATATGVSVTWRGTGDGRNPRDALTPYLARLASQLQGQKVTVDFRALDYVNSSTVGVMLQFVKQLDGNASHVVVRYDGTIDWQRVNCACMRAIARTLRNVKVIDS